MTTSWIIEYIHRTASAKLLEFLYILSIFLSENEAKLKLTCTMRIFGVLQIVPTALSLSLNIVIERKRLMMTY